jgi:hypothetical protein
MKLISAIVLVGLLAACNVGATSPSEQTLPTVTPSTGTVGSTAASASTPAVAMSCTDAFAAIDLSGTTSVTDLMNLTDEVDTTISDCQTLADWTAAVQTYVPDVQTDDAKQFIQERCADNPTLATTPLCTEVAS